MAVEAQWLDTEELSTELHVTAEVVRQWIRQGKIPAVRIGKRWLVRREAFERWIAAQPQSVAEKEEA
jgi:excisionase family DNA binding protein